MISQALPQPLFRLLYLPFPQICLGQIGTDPRQKGLDFQIETDAQALTQQPACLQCIAAIERNKP